jgi:predicted metal-dependent enzyme (double-stranded beta helix superfamily)
VAAKHRLRAFIRDLTKLVAHSRDATILLESGAELLRELVAHDDWLPEIYAWPDPERYRQYLLYCDPLERFSVVSFVWGPGQATPIHDHHLWGLIGVLRGAEHAERFTRNADGSLRQEGGVALLRAGDVDAVGPDIGDIHRVSNAYSDSVSISIHVYGGNIGAVERATYGEDGAPRRFISGYANPEPEEIP